MQPQPTLRAACHHAGRILRRIDNSVMPLRCVFCGVRSIPGEGRVCGGCRDDLPWIAKACGLCGEPVAADLARGVHCGTCQKFPPPFQAMIAPLRYEFPVDVALKALKFGRRLHYAQAFSELLIEEMQRRSPDVDALLPVPLHWKRQAFRGFNQATELVRPLARRYALPTVVGVARRRATPFQSGLTASERSKNLHNAFVIRKPLEFEHVLIVDDVVTTGATTRQLAKELLRNGVARVSVLAVARAT